VRFTCLTVAVTVHFCCCDFANVRI